ncbi:MAG: NnrU family protein [Pseudomonadota bacterium]
METEMGLLIAGLVLFWAGHALPIFYPPKRAKLAARLGDGGIKGATTLVLLIALIMIVIGYQRADFITVWYPPGWLVHVNNLLMVIAVAIFISGSLKGWPADKIRHPQLTGVKIWAVAHSLVNGDLASIILFGGLLGWAVAAMIALNKRDGKAPLEKRSTPKSAALHVVATLVVFGVVSGVHTYLGYSPFPGGA